MSDVETPHRTVAWFATLEQVRAAEVALERHGVDAVHISVQAIDSVGSRRKSDRRAFRWCGRRVVVGAVIGAVIGALIGLALAVALDYSGSDVWAFAMAGGIFGVAPGFFYTADSRLPAEPETFDTFADEPSGPTWIAVGGPDEVRRAATEGLVGLHPTRIVDDV